MKKSIRLLSLLLALALPVLPGAYAEGEEALTALCETATFIRKDKPAESMTNYQNMQVDGNDTTARYGLVRFDLKQLRDVLLNDAVSVRLRVTTENDAAGESNRFGIYQLSERSEIWPDIINYQDAFKMGVVADLEKPVYTSPQGLLGETDYLTGDILPDIRQNLLENPLNSIVSYKIAGLAGGAYSIGGKGSGDGKKPALLIQKAPAPDSAEAVRQTKEKLSFGMLSTESEETVTRDLYLPRLGAGGTVISWASTDQSLVNPVTGQVTPNTTAEGKAALLTATLSNGGVIDTKSFALLLPPAEGKPLAFELKESAFIRRNREASFTAKMTTIQLDPTADTRMGFFRFDLTGNRELLLNDAASVRLRVKTCSDAAGNAKNQFAVYLMEQGQEGWEKSNLSFAEAERLGMTVSAGPLYTSPVGLEGERDYITGNLLEAVREHLKQTPGDAALIFKVSGVTGSAYSMHGTDAADSMPTLLVSTQAAPDDQEAVRLTGQALTFDLLSADSMEEVRNNLYLPATGAFGANITWSSSDAAVLNPVTGVITNNELEGKAVTLTASITKGGASDSKEFFLLVPGVSGTVETVPLSEFAFIRKGYTAEQTNKMKFFQIDSTDSPRMGILRFDLAGLRELILNDAAAVRLSLAAFPEVEKNAANQYGVYLLSREQENWEKATLSYAQAEAMGMVGSANLVYTSPIAMKGDSMYSSGDLSGAIKAHLLEQPGDTVVSFKVAGLAGTPFSMHAQDEEAFVPKLTIVTNVELAAEEAVQRTKAGLTEKLLTTQAADRITRDLYLPRTGVSGAAIAWESSNPDVIGQTGTVNRPAQPENTAVTLTASITKEQARDTAAFQFVVKKAGLELQTLPMASHFMVRKGKEAMTMPTIQLDPGKELRMGFVKFDMTGLRDALLNDAVSLKLRLTPQPDAADPEIQFAVYLLPQSMEDWTGPLSFEQAEAKGMVGDTSCLCYKSPLPFTQGTGYYADGMLEAVKRHLLENPQDQTVVFKIAAVSGSAYSMFASGGDENTIPMLFMETYQTQERGAVAITDVSADDQARRITARLTNTTDTALEGLTAYAAEYNYDGQLLSVKAVRLDSLSPAQPQEVAFDFGQEAALKCYKIMVWDSGTLMPRAIPYRKLR